MGKVKNHEADISNDNKGTYGVNITRKKNLDNTANQFNPNNPKFTAKKNDN